MNPIKNKKDLETTIDEIKNFAYSYLDKYNPSKQDQISYINTIKYWGEKVDLKPLLLRPDMSDNKLVKPN